MHRLYSSHVGLNLYSRLHKDLNLCFQVIEGLREWNFKRCLICFLSRRFFLCRLRGLHLCLRRDNIAALIIATSYIVLIIVLDLSIFCILIITTLIHAATGCHLNTFLLYCLLILWNLHLWAIFITFVLFDLHSTHLEFFDRSHINLRHVVCLIAWVDVFCDILRLLHNKTSPLFVLPRIFNRTWWLFNAVHHKRFT